MFCLPRVWFVFQVTFSSNLHLQTQITEQEEKPVLIRHSCSYRVLFSVLPGLQNLIVECEILKGTQAQTLTHSTVRGRFLGDGTLSDMMVWFNLHLVDPNLGDRCGKQF